MADIPRDDPRVEALVAIYALAGQRLENTLNQLAVAEAAQQFRLFQEVLSILRELEQKTDRWAAQFIPQFVSEADQEALALLQQAGAQALFAASISDEAIQGLINTVRNRLSAARASVSELATRIFRSPALESEFPQLALQVRRTVEAGLTAQQTTKAIQKGVAEKLRTVFSDGVVSVIGKGGRRFTFALDYYAAMVASATKRQARTVAMLQRATEGGFDLVRVSPNPSVGDDWCNAYRGRVYSITGASPTYPPLASLPNGGPPFHPFCKHSISIHVPDFFSDKQNAAFANTQEQFLMRPNEDSPNRVVRNWWAAKNQFDDPAPLEFI